MPVVYPNISKAGKWDILIQQGSSFARTLIFSNLDLTDFSFRGSIKQKFTDRSPIAVYDITLVSNTEIEVSLTPAASASLPTGMLQHDIEMFYEENGTDLYVARIAEGKVRVTPEVTK